MIKDEFSLINRIRQVIGRPAQRMAGREKDDVIVGPGDDTAVLKTTKDKYILFTCDSLAENVHFSLDYAKPQDLGWKALAVNASDIAAMAGRAQYAIISLILNKKISEKWVNELYKGFKKFIKKYPLSLVGGNISRSDSSLVIDIAMLGEVEKNKFVKRSTAKVGDLIGVTGTLGDSAAGMKILKKGSPSAPDVTPACQSLAGRSERASRNNAFLCKKHLRPNPRLKEIREITSKVKLNSLIDISDGFTQDLSHILEACPPNLNGRESNLAASIDISKIPLSLQLKKFAKKKAINYALDGGEDYELLFTLPKKEAKKLPSRVNGTPLTIVGEIIAEGNNPKIIIDGKVYAPRGYNHFK